MHSLSIYGLLPQKNFSPRLLLLFIPCLFLGLSLYNLSIQGPFYSFNNIDPSYAYLFNGFELLHFHAPGHVDHPGTTTQILMALVILIKWLFTAASGWIAQQPMPSLDHLFFTEPEGFLQAGAFTLIGLNTLLFSVVSLKLFNLAKKQEVVFAFQLGLLLFFPVIETFSMFTPEPMLLTGVLLLCLGLFPVLIKNEGSDPKYARYFGLALGFGMATKVTFLPLGLLLFLFPRIQQKKIVKFAAISFLICTFPIWGRYFNMAKWLFKIAFHEGIYGTGSVGLVNSSKIIDHAKQLIAVTPFLFVTLTALSAYLIFSHKKNVPIINKFLILSLGALLFSLCLNLKHPGVRYMVPVLLLCAPLAAVIAYQYGQYKKIYIMGLYAIMLSGVGLSGIDYQKWHQLRVLESKGRANFEAYVATHHCKVIGYGLPSLQSYAMFFGNQWGWKKRTQILDKYYPDTVFFEPSQEVFFDFHGPNHYLLDKAEVEQQLKQHACVVFQGLQLTLPKNSAYQARISEKTLDNHQSYSGKFYEFKTG